tara:strand:- start:23017 stop:24021 length:1005 start_codon:yes stop_codon:yes gene_type:complete
MRQRRRAERQNTARPTLKDNVHNRTEERYLQRILIGAALALGLLIIGLLATGWYFNFLKPPEKIVASVNGEDYLLHEVVPYTKIEGFYTSQFNPNIALNTLIKNNTLDQFSQDQGIDIQLNQVENKLITMFEKATGTSDVPSSLSQEGERELENFVNLIGIEVSDYKNWIRGQLLEDAYFDLFLTQASKTADQVFLEWIVAANSISGQNAYERISSGENFNSVATELNVDNIFADKEGVVGWVPKGALLEMDPYLFAIDNQTNSISPPIVTSLGSIVYRITNNSKDREISESMRILLAQNNFQSWMDQITSEIIFTFNDDDIKWVLGQIEREYE